jgi:hypothetical protein
MLITYCSSKEEEEEEAMMPITPPYTPENISKVLIQKRRRAYVLALTCVPWPL